jgi:hypothetical protein
MQPMAELTAKVEVTLQPTAGMVLPLVNKMINLLGEDQDVDVGDTVMKGCTLVPSVIAGRKAVRDDMYYRWVTEMHSSELVPMKTAAGRKRAVRKCERFRKLAISTILHPAYKKWTFPGSERYDKEKVMNYVREEYLANWAPAATTGTVLEQGEGTTDKEGDGLTVSSFFCGSQN